MYAGTDFQVKGGKGKIRDWAVGQAAILKALVSWVVRQEHRSSGAARSDRILVLKKIIQLKQAMMSIAIAPVASASDAVASEFCLQDCACKSGGYVY